MTTPTLRVYEDVQLAADEDAYRAAADSEWLAEDVLAQDVLVEEVSIDGMCGVY